MLCTETLPGHSHGHECPEQPSKGPHPGQGTQRAWGTHRTTHAYSLNRHGDTQRSYSMERDEERIRKKFIRKRKDEWFKVKVKVTQSCLTFCNPMECPWNFLGQNTGVGSLSLSQGIFPTQGSNPGLLHCRQILYQLSHKGSATRFLFAPAGRGPGAVSASSRDASFLGRVMWTLKFKKCQKSLKFLLIIVLRLACPCRCVYVRV